MKWKFGMDARRLHAELPRAAQIYDINFPPRTGGDQENAALLTSALKSGAWETGKCKMHNTDSTFQRVRFNFSFL